MKTPLVILLVLAALALAGHPRPVSGQNGEPGPAGSGFTDLVASEFQGGREGWSVLEGGTTATPKWNPGGQAVVFVSEEPWYWAAPAKFLGDLSAAYGGLLAFKISENPSSDAEPTAGDDVILKSAISPHHGSPLTLVFRGITAPTFRPRVYQVPLNESSGWVVEGEGRRPTRHEFVCLLARLSQVLIRGRFRPATDFSADRLGVLYSAAVFKPKGLRSDAVFQPLPRETQEFGSVSIGESKTKEIRVTNRGQAPLSVQVKQPVTATSRPRRDVNFSAAPAAGSCGVVAPGESVVLRVKYAPTNAGRHRAVLRIKTNERVGAEGRRRRPVRYLLTGRGRRGTENHVVCVEGSLDFGTVMVDQGGSGFSERFFHLKNVRELPWNTIYVRDEEPPGPNEKFSFPHGAGQMGENLPVSLRPGQTSRLLKAIFTPQVPGQWERSVIIYDGDVILGRFTCKGKAIRKPPP